MTSSRIPIVAVAMATIVVIGLCACRKKSRAVSRAATTQREPVIDDAGHPVDWHPAAQRIVSLSPANTEILFAIGCGDKIVLRDSASDYPEIAKRVPKTDPFQMSIDHISSYTPDLVLIGATVSQRVHALRAMKFAVAQFDSRTFAGLERTIRRIGKLCGTPKVAEELAGNIGKRVDRIKTRVAQLKSPTVYAEIDASDPMKPWTAGRGSIIDHLIRTSGARNIAHMINRPYAQISAERVVSSDPDMVLICHRPGDLPARNRLAKRAVWKRLRAIRQGHIIDSINADLLVRPGPRLIDGLELLATALHPSAFAEGDPKESLR